MYGYNYQPNYYPSPAMPGQLEQLRMGQQPQQQPQQQNGLIWVQGEAGAKSYMVANGNSVLLMDSESQTFYLKSADASGMPSMRIFDYQERAQQKPAPVAAQNAQEYVTRNEFNALAAKIEALTAKPVRAGKEENNESAV